MCGILRGVTLLKQNDSIKMIHGRSMKVQNKIVEVQSVGEVDTNEADAIRHESFLSVLNFSCKLNAIEYTLHIYCVLSLDVYSLHMYFYH